MRASELEAWALEIIERVKSNQPVEDSRVELKAEWLDPERAARRLAGHCNAARGESVLWLVGIDEETGVVGANQTELADWLPSVARTFESVHPDLIRDINIALDDKTVVALLFSTDRAPYVVRNPRYGKENGGPVEYEVPWREGTGVRSARHTDLIRLLVPIHHAPRVEVISCELYYPSDDSPWAGNYILTMDLYLVCHDKGRVIVPFHRCKARIGIGTLSFSAMEPRFETLSNNLLGTVRCTPHDLIVDGAGMARLVAVFSSPESQASGHDEATYSLSLRTADADFPTVVAGKLARKTDGQWELPEHAT